MGVLMSESASSGNRDPSPDLVEMVEGMTYNVGSAVMALWHGDLQSAAWYVSREIGRLRKGASPETPEMASGGFYPYRALIRIGRWEYEAEISQDGVASYENRAGSVVQAADGHYKLIRYR